MYEEPFKGLYLATCMSMARTRWKIHPDPCASFSGTCSCIALVIAWSAWVSWGALVADRMVEVMKKSSCS